ncbi:peptidoglycan editing factor PgeF [Marinobacter panjinensis]|uniref:Purine nucleoside phosphorylase n=1 Tax=Marinobacter panjinensis TaxID=2576384 RepID=A0A4U6QQT8_9GAMM|nr:peptidoglycan editing factor PgeF [Marinobacter panjinensis]MCR8916533.1 peptidoglycan editing factor PgeF [Marinobacter panjinensis]TKV63254.1 peptidoglycan editing factor PgeF [Marinobacter panjinensis]
MTFELPLIVPDWPAPSWVNAASTTRVGGVSKSPWDSLNLGTHVGDDLEDVTKNRALLGQWAEPGAQSFGWLNQVHGTHVAELPQPGQVTADACVTSQPGAVCAVLTADCLPVLFCDPSSGRVAAAHAGWRGLCDGVLERTLEHLGNPASVLAWLGPAIGPEQFEVGAEVRDAFLLSDPQAGRAFAPSPRHPGRYLADIYELARQRLAAAGVLQVYGGGFCTVTDSDRFFSYRRDGQTGRMASLIFIS